MDISILILIVLVTGVGFLLGYIVRKLVATKSVNSAEAKAEHIIHEAKSKEKEVLLEAKDKALAVMDQAKKDEEARRREVQKQQQRLEKRESLFDQKLLDLESKQNELTDKSKQIHKSKEEIQAIRAQQLEKLEKIAELSQEEAKDVLLENVEIRAKDDILNRLRKLDEVGSHEWDEKSRKLLSLAMERCASSHAVETTTTSLTLPSDEMKGRIIGKEGRNIKTLEQLTGVEVIIDETPQTLLISGFSPIRRHLAKKALERLMVDGRIHPGRIEETVEEAKKEIALDMKKAGEEAAYDAGVAGLHPKLVQILGRLKYRTSYGQNVLSHSVEIAHLSVLLAEELGANVELARKGGLLHDIGKAVDHEIEGGHPKIGYDICKKFGLQEEVGAICSTHHEDHPEQLETVIVKVADAVSGARPGARKDTYEQYLQRLGELEDIATGFEGVEKAYAIQAGREIRVFVQPGEVDDFKAHELAREIADKIEAELKYPGEIKVNVIRNTRVVEYAR
ncbi:ribonuclease Y [bacterium]|jgi:ribonuclease Y|nr:ribonuclease Y [bacterium]MDP6756575.1 ribonuclease Y [Patescibacteria group bacterium]|tara:strand:+ start:38925 stop:40448 length:1524 start_codon:yes stop_codon:yes gene_type:complete